MSRVPRLLVVLAAGLVLTGCKSSQHSTPGAAGSPSAPASSVPSPSAPPPAPSSPAESPPAPAPPGPADSSTGIAGVTVAMGHCPVIRDESSCPEIPIATTFTVVDATGKVVMTVRSGADGHFRVAVRPGKYVLEAPMKLPRMVPTPVTVDAGHYTDITMHFDTGVR